MWRTLPHCELCGFPSGQVATAGYLCESADASNEHPQVLGGSYQHTWISCSHHCIVGQLGFPVPVMAALGSRLRQQLPLQHHTTQRERGRWHTSTSRVCLQVPFVTAITCHWGKPVLRSCLISEGVGKSSLFLCQEFWQVAPPTVLRMSCPCLCPSEPPSSQHTMQLLVSESSVECSSTPSLGPVCPGLCPHLSPVLPALHLFALFFLSQCSTLPLRGVLTSDLQHRCALTQGVPGSVLTNLLYPQ